MAQDGPIATFTRKHPQTNETQTRDAYSPAEVVNLTADGWVEKTSSKSTSTSTSGSAASGSAASGRSS